MKNICRVAVALILLITCTGCNNQIGDVSVETSDKDTSSIVSDAEKSESTISEEIASSDDNSNYVDEIIGINDNIITIDNYKTLDVESISFEQKSSNGETFFGPLFPTAYSNNSIYVISEYYTRTETENTQNSILSYDINTNEKKELFSFDFDVGYNPDFVFNGHYFTLPCTKSNDGPLTISIIDYDEENGAQKTIYQETVTSPYYYADYLSENEVVFLIFPEIGEKTYQRVLKYNLTNGAVDIIYENEYISTEAANNVSENIWTMDTFNGSIFLLNTQVVEGERSWIVCKLNSEGNIINKANLTGLYDYRDANCSVNQFVVTKDKYLIQYYDSGKNSSFVAVERENPSKSVQFERLVPCTLASPFWIKDRYLIYSTFPDYCDYENNVYSSDISIYDSKENMFYFIKLQLSPEYKTEKIISNEKGDIVLVVFDDAHNFKFLSVADILSYIE